MARVLDPHNNADGFWRLRGRIIDYLPARLEDWVRATCPDCDMMCVFASSFFVVCATILTFFTSAVSNLSSRPASTTATSSTTTPSTSRSRTRLRTTTLSRTSISKLPSPTKTLFVLPPLPTSALRADLAASSAQRPPQPPCHRRHAHWRRRPRSAPATLLSCPWEDRGEEEAQAGRQRGARW